MPDTSPLTREILAQAAQPQGLAFVGFDGYVDSLYKVVKARSGGHKTPYADIPEFSNELLSRAGKSGGFELDRLSVRAGGNAPLMAQGLTALGVKTACVAAMGEPGLHASFVPLQNAGCELVTVAEAAATVALEFDDGKCMLNDSLPFELLDWKTLLKAAGLERLRGLARPAQLLALVDWANMPHGSALWTGVLEDLLEGGPKVPGRRIFFDVADISRRSAEDVRALMPLLSRFKAHGEVTLGLNENEALKLADKLGLGGAATLEALGGKILQAVPVDCLLIHPRERAVVFQGGQTASAPGRVIAKPLLSTGGGDHFNAGFCLGLLLGLTPLQSAELAVRVSGLYVEKGRSPRLEDLLASF